MAEREAAVRLTLDNGQFIVSLRKAGDENVEQQKRATRGAQAWSAGVGRVGDNFKALTSTIRNAVSAAATLGGAFSVGTAIQHNLALTAQYKSLAFAIRSGTGETVRFQELQERGSAIANRWKQSNADVATALAQLRDEVGDTDFAVAGAEEAAKAATASGKPIKVFTDVVGALNEQFGITKEEAPEALAGVIGAANRGGVVIEDLAAQLKRIGPSAQLAGIQGKDGLVQILGMLNAVEGKVRKPFAAVSQFLDLFASPELRATAQKKLGIQIGPDGDPGKVLQQIIQKTKGDKKELAKVFGGEQLKVAVEIGKTYAQAFEQSTGSIKDRTAAATAAFEQGLAAAGKSAFTAADLQKAALDGLDDPQRKLQAAITRLEEAFADERIIAGIEKLADKLPALAELVSDIVGFALDNPKTAAAAGVGVLAGGSFLQGSIGALLTGAGGKFAREAFGGAAVTQAGAAAGSRFAALAFSPAVIALVGAGIIGAVIDWQNAEDAKRDAERKEKDQKKAKGLQEELQRTGRKDLSAEEMDLLERTSEGGRHEDKIARSRAAQTQSALEVAGMGPAGKALVGAGGERLLSTLGAVQGAGMSPESLGLERIKMPGMLALPPGATPITAPASKSAAGQPSKVKIEDQESFAQVLARAMRAAPLRVEIAGGDAGTDATRGPPRLPAPGAR